MYGRNKSHSYRHRRPHKDRWLPLVVIGLLVIFVYYWFSHDVTSPKTIEYRKVLQQTKNDFIQAQRQAARDFGGKHSFETLAHLDEDREDTAIDSVIAGDINVDKNYDYDNESTEITDYDGESKDATTTKVYSNITSDSYPRAKQNNESAKSNFSETIIRKVEENVNISKEHIAKIVNKTGQALKDLDHKGREHMDKLLNSSDVQVVNNTLKKLSNHFDNLTNYVSNTSVKLSQSSLAQKASNLSQHILEKHGNNTRTALKSLGKNLSKLQDNVNAVAQNVSSNLNDRDVQSILRNVGATNTPLAVNLPNVNNTSLNNTAHEFHNKTNN